MLHHFSFNAREPTVVAEGLAKIVGGRALRAPSPPFPAESWFVCLGDDFGTLIEVMPWGEIRDATKSNGVGHDPEMRRSSGSHILIGTPLSCVRLWGAAAHYGWRTELASAGLFKFVKMWVENSFLVELLPPEHHNEYLRAFGREGIDQLDWKLRELEGNVRAVKAAGR